jgi:hypothetical protein
MWQRTVVREHNEIWLHQGMNYQSSKTDQNGGSLSLQGEKAINQSVSLVKGKAHIKIGFHHIIQCRESLEIQFFPSINGHNSDQNKSMVTKV